MTEITKITNKNGQKNGVVSAVSDVSVRFATIKPILSDIKLECLENEQK